MDGAYDKKYEQSRADYEGCCVGTTGNTTDDVKPRESLCVEIKLDTLFDFSKSGAYSVRVDRYDEPDGLPGEKIQELPIAQSNAIAITIPDRTAE